MSMKRLAVLAALVVAFGTVLAAPAFAQHDPNAYHRGRESDPRRPKTLHRAHPASRSVKHKK